MGRSKIDPQAAIRGFFDDGQDVEAKPRGAKAQSRKPARAAHPRITDLGSKFLTVEEVAQRYGVAKATVWRWVKNDPNFPEPIKLSPGTSRWTEEQLRVFERHAAKRGASNAKGQAGTSGARSGRGAAE